jgi:hypothetical protein
VERLVREKTNHQGSERRRSRRLPIALPVAVTPLDEQLQATGPVFLAVTQNISASGVCLISDVRCPAKFLSLRLVNNSSDQIDAAVRVRRYRMVGPMHEYGVQFIPTSA